MREITVTEEKENCTIWSWRDKNAGQLLTMTYEEAHVLHTLLIDLFKRRQLGQDSSTPQEKK